MARGAIRRTMEEGPPLPRQKKDQGTGPLYVHVPARRSARTGLPTTSVSETRGAHTLNKKKNMGGATAARTWCWGEEV